jgi:hypothetical protein
MTQVNASEFSITLQCDINFTNFNYIEHETISKTVTLSNYKHKYGGTALVSQTDDYEFWVMIYSVQTLNERKFVNNFQVAIKNKRNNYFAHALSDTTHSPEDVPKRARISLMDYRSNSFVENGELFFECRNQEIKKN